MESNAPGPIAMLDSRLLAGRNYEEFLSRREQEEFLRFRTPLRKSEWLAGRLSSKFLFLSQSGGMLSAADWTASRPPCTGARKLYETIMFASDSLR